MRIINRSTELRTAITLFVEGNTSLVTLSLIQKKKINPSHRKILGKILALKKSRKQCLKPEKDGDFY